MSPGPPAGAGAAAATGAPVPGEPPPEAFATALAGLPRMGPARLAAVLAGEPPAAAWRRVAAGRGWADPGVVRALGADVPALVGRWRSAAAAVHPGDVWRRAVDAGIAVAVLGTPAYPPALAGDIEPPAVLFHRGDPCVLGGPRVAVVGTRRCSTTGAGVAFELGRDLAAAGVRVVSGLASGIDAAAHRGALAAGGAPPIGVVGSGLDVVYPRGQDDLWRAVAAAGVLLSEAPPGALPERWRFPARNRIIAALADLVVVVESHRRGGSLHTVDEADRRGRDVFVVPGSVRNPAAAGTNELLAEGRAPVCSVADLLVALGLGAARRAAPGDRRVPPTGGDATVLEAVGWQPATLDQLALRTGLGLAQLAPALDRLCETGWLARRGGWYERLAAGAAG
ncbi:MAG TPA: DNA-processing protein DprA [Acidimicrobiales bacterium]